MPLHGLQFPASRFGGFEFKFARVNVILGANGSGKSRLLSDLRDAVPKMEGGSKVVFIEGGRAIQIADVLQLDAKNFQHYDRLESALKHWDRKRNRSLADRVSDALHVLEKRELALKAQHSDAAIAWSSGSRTEAFPVRPRAPLTRLFELFSDVFPSISLSYDYNAKRLKAVKNGQEYGPSTLSDGEKQVFSILADFIEVDEAYQVIVADEPELNLHPELAERLWTLIENEFPGRVFIYATHSINFALRENVDKVFVLSSDSERIAELNGLEDLPRKEVRAFLGGLPGILSANRVVVTEGHEKSFDALFYRWLLGDNKIEVHAAGSCSDVVGVVTRAGIWEKISTKVGFYGVVDADFRADTYLATLPSKGICVLSLHEAESYLCLPEVVASIAQHIGSQDLPLTEDDVKQEILRTLSEQRWAVAARRVLARAHIVLAVGIERNVLKTADSRSALLQALQTASASELKKAQSTIGAHEMESMLDAELLTIDNAIAARDFRSALSLLPAKPLVQTLAIRAGCKNSTDLMRSLRQNFSPAAFPLTADLKARIEALARSDTARPAPVSTADSVAQSAALTAGG